MPNIRRLQPHDPLPEVGRNIIVMRRLGEDAPNMAVTEIIFSDGPRQSATAAVHPDGTAMAFEDAVRHAVDEADRRGYKTVYALDRTAGPREREVLAHKGDHTFGSEELVDGADEIATDQTPNAAEE
jgi:hypothetical protein